MNSELGWHRASFCCWPRSPNSQNLRSRIPHIADYKAPLHDALRPQWECSRVWLWAQLPGAGRSEPMPGPAADRRRGQRVCQAPSPLRPSGQAGEGLPVELTGEHRHRGLQFAEGGSASAVIRPTAAWVCPKVVNRSKSTRPNPVGLFHPMLILGATWHQCPCTWIITCERMMGWFHVLTSQACTGTDLRHLSHRADAGS